MDSEVYFPIHAQSLVSNPSILAHDIYLRLGPNKYTKIFSRGNEIETPRAIKYIEKGLFTFHILKKERRNYLTANFQRLLAYEKSHELNKTEALQLMTDLASQTLDEVFSTHKFDVLCAQLSQHLVYQLIGVTSKNPTTLPQLVKMVKIHPHVYRHSILCSIFSSLLARQLEPQDTTFQMNAGLAGFLHDIGLCQLPKGVDEFSPSLSDELTLRMQRHPLLGAQLLANTRSIPDIVRQAISEHHERTDGSGFPRKLSGINISRLGRLLALTESFSSMVFGSRHNHPLSPGMALQALESSRQYDLKMTKELARLLLF